LSVASRTVVTGSLYSPQDLESACPRTRGRWDTPEVLMTHAMVARVGSCEDAWGDRTACECCGRLGNCFDLERPSRDHFDRVDGYAAHCGEHCGGLDGHETVLVAEDGGETVGVAAFGWFRDVSKRPGYRFTVENTVHVREDRWRSGVGRELMRALIDVARRTGKHTMVAAVDGANQASIDFHHRLGFVEVARMPEIGAKFGRWQDLVVLQLRLDERTAP
jgi:L-amino acid N-acyltransferase